MLTHPNSVTEILLAAANQRQMNSGHTTVHARGQRMVRTTFGQNHHTVETYRTAGAAP